MFTRVGEILVQTASAGREFSESVSRLSMKKFLVRNPLAAKAPLVAPDMRVNWRVFRVSVSVIPGGRLVCPVPVLDIPTPWGSKGRF